MTTTRGDRLKTVGHECREQRDRFCPMQTLNPGPRVSPSSPWPEVRWSSALRTLLSLVPLRTTTATGRVESTGTCQRTAGVHQAADLQIQAAAPSGRSDVEPVAEVIDLMRCGVLGAQFPKPAALEDDAGCWRTLVHLPRHRRSVVDIDDVDPDLDDKAPHLLPQDLGHSRVRITACYTGARQRGRPPNSGVRPSDATLACPRDGDRAGSRMAVPNLADTAIDFLLAFSAAPHMRRVSHRRIKIPCSKRTLEVPAVQIEFLDRR